MVWNKRFMRKNRERLFAEQRGLCYYCGEPMLLAKIGQGQAQPPRLATLDHIIPRSLGGTNAPTMNCVAACRQCNQERGTQDARMFLLQKQGLA